MGTARAALAAVSFSARNPPRAHRSAALDVLTHAPTRNANANAAIPGGATLYFEVELMGLEGGAAAPKKKAHHHHHGHDHAHGHDHDHDHDL